MAEIALPPAPTRTDAAAAPIPTGLRLLLVDDNEFNRRVGVKKLQSKGHVVQAVEGGKEALALLESERFDVILTDMQMPDMDGLELTAAIRQREACGGGHVPIIAMTAHVGSDVRASCQRGGMDGYVSKPLQDHELWNELQRVLGPKRPQSDPVAVHALPAARSESLDHEAILARVGGNRLLLQELVDVFQNDCARLISEIRAGLDASDGLRVRNAAHPLKSMLGFFAADSATQLAVRIESLGEQGDLAAAREIFPSFQEEVERLRTLLANLCSGTGS